jgi:hypothetical protein
MKNIKELSKFLRIRIKDTFIFKKNLLYFLKMSEVPVLRVILSDILKQIIVIFEKLFKKFKVKNKFFNILSAFFTQKFPRIAVVAIIAIIKEQGVLLIHITGRASIVLIIKNIRSKIINFLFKNNIRVNLRARLKHLLRAVEKIK